MRSAAGVVSIRPGLLQISQLFAFQSFFDQTNFEKGILPQAPNDPIVASTLQDPVQTPGYGLGLHPSSQTPVAVELMGISNCPTITLVPGQVIYPTNREVKFSGFRWGLPFGWLGGGSATLVVIGEKTGRVDFPHQKPEIIFHRASFKVWQPSDLTAANDAVGWPKNWPMRFPWTQAQRVISSTAVAQSGKAQVAITPTRVVMQLRTALAAAASIASAKMRVLFQGTNDLGLDSAGAVISTFPAFVDVTWPAYTNLGTSGNFSAAIPALEFYAGPLVRLAADDGTVIFLDASGASTLSGLKVDVVRYGYL